MKTYVHLRTNLLVLDICKKIDTKNTGTIPINELIPYIEEQSQPQPINTTSDTWPQWLITEKKTTLIKELLAKLNEAIEQQGLISDKAFNVYDQDNTGLIESTDFAKVINKLCKSIGIEEQ